MREQISLLRQAMKRAGADACLVPTSDYHGSEYVDGFFKARRFLTGFTGSAGTAVVTQDFAGLWTDGRYFIQAAKQLEGSGIVLEKMGQEGVPTVQEFLADTLKEGQTLAFDGRVVDLSTAERLNAVMEEKGVKIRMDLDLPGEIWTDRPALSRKKAWLMSEEQAGESRRSKLTRLRKAMKEAGADVHLIPSLDDIAWLFNIRGGDVHCNPVVLSYAAVEAEKAILFVQEGVVDEADAAALAADGVELRPYDSFYDYAASLNPESCVWFDPQKANAAMVGRLPAQIRSLRRVSPIVLWKAQKNPVEMDAIRRAHVKDGVAMTKFICWFHKNVGKIKMTEISASDYLESLRREQEGFLDLSFDTISAYGANAAMAHYSATEESNAEVLPRGFLLVDSGAQFTDGTTDVTRTMAAGELTEEEKLHYTLVLAGHIRLAMARFPEGVRGLNLDVLARGPLWQRGLDYNHGTGHGVGFVLNVHEAPNGFRWRVVPERMDSAVLTEGMLTSDEPGYYEEGSHGIRTENLMLCVEDGQTAYGRFLKFETVTLCPIDKEPILPELLTDEEIGWLNDYHARVRAVIGPHLTEEERAWLEEATSPLTR